MHRFLEEEAKKQGNMESITERALPLLGEQSSPQNVDDDWITNFFDRCRIVSDEDMQRLWSRVLAGEANVPGSFSRRTVNLLGDLDKRDAESFTSLCGFGWMIGSICPLVFDVQGKFYNSHGIDFVALSNLETLGLIQFNNISGFVQQGLPKRFKVFYYGKSVELTLPKDTNNDLMLGKVLLTRAGQELALICGSRPVEGFFDFVYDHWAVDSLVPKREIEQEPAAND